MGKKKHAAQDNAPRMAFGSSVLNDERFRQAATTVAAREGVTPQEALALATGQPLATVLAAWPEPHLPANQAGNHHELVADLERAGGEPLVYVDRDGNEYYDAPDLGPDTIAHEFAGAGALPVSQADLDTVEEALRLLELSRRDSGGDCWYCGQEGNPADPADHNLDCGWRRLDALRLRLGAALGTHACPACGSGDVIDQGRGDGPECQDCGLLVGSTPVWDTQDGQEVRPQHGPRDTEGLDDSVPF